MVHKGKKLFLKNLRNSQAPKNDESEKVSKKAKIIVRNLPFKNLSEKSVEEFFREYGDIQEVKLLKKDDGKFIGCGFVQFKKVSSAAKAIRHANQKEMSGRTIIVDWALPKKTFLEKVQKLQGNLENDVKSEVLSDSEIFDFEIDKKPSAQSSIEGDSDLESVGGRKADKRSNGHMEDGSDSENDDDEDEGSGDGGGGIDSSDEFSAEEDNNSELNDKKLNKINQKQNNSDDIEDGRTVFIRNIPFSATNDDLKNCVESFGPVEYALICIDKLTEHSKGTGFVKFKDPESASQCIKNSTKIHLHENPLTVTMALSKSNLENKKNSKKTVKDSRNLYLIREGVVIAGSKAAAGVSAGDMAKRLQLEQWKNQILKNLNMFVSRTRLVIHNLPPFYDDSKLRNLFAKYSNPKAVVKEAKVMYDKKKLDSAGKGTSKEVGFVSFTNHEDALQALRNINNNPVIFTPKKRPIVAFSIENKAVINSKVKRLEKSRAKLGINDEKPDKLSKLNRKQRRFIRRREKFIQMRKESAKLKQESTNNTEKTVENRENNDRKRKKSEELKSNKKIKREEPNEEEKKEFTGLMSESGKKIKLRSKFRLKHQANIHSQTLKAERRKRREKERKKMAVRKPPKEKKGKTKLIDDVHLSKLLKKHRESIQQSSVTRKWYDNQTV